MINCCCNKPYHLVSLPNENIHLMHLLPAVVYRSPGRFKVFIINPLASASTASSTSSASIASFMDYISQKFASISERFGAFAACHKVSEAILCNLWAFCAMFSRGFLWMPGCSLEEDILH